MTSIFPSNHGALLAGVAAAAAGFTGDGLLTAIAVAGAESTFDPNAINDKPSETPRGEPGPCKSIGLWQINVCPGRDDANPNRGGGVPETLLDPLTNARAAYAISSGGVNWQPWGGFTSGGHTKWLEDARKTVNLLDTDGGRESIAEMAKTGTVKKKGGGSGISIGGLSIPIPNPIDIGKQAIGVGTGVAGGVIDLAKKLNPLDELASLAAGFAKLVKFIVDPKNWLRVLAAVAANVLVLVGIALIVADQNPELTKAATTAAITKGAA